MPWRIETRLISSVPAPVLNVKQTHGGHIAWAEHIDAATIADGIAARSNFTRPFMIKTADCLPLVIASAEAACALHVSRKSLIHGLLDRAAETVNPAAITQVHMGPCICEEHFVFEEIGPEIEAFQHMFPSACRTSSAGLHLSLKKAVEMYLERWHVAPDLASADLRCTLETLDLPSYKRSLRASQPLADHVATIVASA